MAEPRPAGPLLDLAFLDGIPAILGRAHLPELEATLAEAQTRRDGIQDEARRLPYQHAAALLQAAAHRWRANGGMVGSKEWVGPNGGSVHD